MNIEEAKQTLREVQKNVIYEEIGTKELEAIDMVLNELDNNKQYIIHLTDEQYRKVIEIAQEDINNKWKTILKNKKQELENIKLCGGAVNQAVCEEEIQMINEILENKE